MGDAAKGLLGRGGLGGVFFLFGEDAFRREEAAAALIAAHLDPSTLDFNCDVVRGREMDVEHLASILSTPPMMADWRVVHVKEVEAIAVSPKLRDLVLETASAPPPGLAVVLEGDIAGSSAKFWKDLQKSARSTEFAALRPEAVPGVLLERAAELGVGLDEDAAMALGAAVGTDLGILMQELDKLAAVAGPEGRITLAVVEDAGIRLPAQDRWRWFDLVAEKRFDEAMTGLTILLQQGETGVGLVLWLGQHFLRLGVAREGGAQGLEPRLPPNQRWLARKLAGQASRWTTDEIEAALAGLLRADRLLKSAALSDGAVLEEWLLARQVGAMQATATPAGARA